MSNTVHFGDHAALEGLIDELSAKDPVIARLAERHGLPVFEMRSITGLRQKAPELAGRSVGVVLFSELVEVVIRQQLASRAAVAIAVRVADAIGGFMTPQAILECPPVVLRATGLSGAKLAAITGLATEVAGGRLLLEEFIHQSDEEVTAEISKLRGFGPWSAQMFLMFSLGRLDIWPSGDLGVRKGYQASYGLDHLPEPRELLDLGERFRPYRSLAAWYMWRSLSG